MQLSSVSVLMPSSRVRIRGTFGDIDPLNKVPFKRARSRVWKGPLEGVSVILPRIFAREMTVVWFLSRST